MANCATCPQNSGKVLTFNPNNYGQNLILLVTVKPGHTGTGTIQINTWNTKPTSSLSGKAWYKNLPAAGGSFSITPDTTKQAISLMQINPSQNNFWDTCCVSLDNLNLTIRIESF
jgi:hypothetical protein